MGMIHDSAMVDVRRRPAVSPGRPVARLPLAGVYGKTYMALCPIYGLTEFERANPHFAKQGAWENVRKGRVEGIAFARLPRNAD